MTSSVLAAVGYERRVLEIVFLSGKVYRYFDVGEDVYERLIAASSHGAFFNEHVRDSYRHVRIA